MKRAKSVGFTLVELLIIIIVIGILATLTVVSYSEVQEQAAESSVKSDLQNAAAQLEKDRARDGVYPATAQAANKGDGLLASDGNTLTYVVRSNGYCVAVASDRLDGASFYKENAEGTIQAGVCAP
jgi:Tfp pilus assembly protein PilE